LGIGTAPLRVFSHLPAGSLRLRELIGCPTNLFLKMRAQHDLTAAEGFLTILDFQSVSP
jgi:hypothetical protein